jgi:hypothetical protein
MLYCSLWLGEKSILEIYGRDPITFVETTKGTAMKKRTLIAIVAAGLLLAACIPSVHPYYLEKDLAFEPKLVGEWQEKDKVEEPQIWKFEEGKEKAYNLTVTEKEGKRGEFEAHLFKLKQEYFLDIVATEIGTNVADLITASLIPGHLLLRVPAIEPELQLAGADFDWLQRYLKEHPKALAHYTENDRIVLTAETADLQSFVLKHLGEGELFGKPGEMIRKSGKGNPSPPTTNK